MIASYIANVTSGDADVVQISVTHFAELRDSLAVVLVSFDTAKHLYSYLFCLRLIYK
jgi:hypothetical protein